ncbi:MAG: hypothetical protein IPM42_04675 [Saprospiraceae bacterium]|nr:hypothetical protein [Saprospiraceae bacterium]
MIEKCRIIYKGDQLAGKFYLLVWIILLIMAIGVYRFTTSEGYFYLIIGLVIFSCYCLGKGIFIIYTASNRLKFLQTFTTPEQKLIADEIEYTEYRITKKVRNRSRYIRIVILSSIVAFGGIFTTEKGLITGSAIPIALISGLESGIGMLTEFRLREYLRILIKFGKTISENDTLNTKTD